MKEVFNARDSNIILNIPVSFRKPPDAWIWFWEPKGNYSVKSCYRMLIGEIHDTFEWHKIWQLNIPPKVKVFCWQLASSFLPTRDALLMKHISCSQVCHIHV